MTSYQLAPNEVVYNCWRHRETIIDILEVHGWATLLRIAPQRKSGERLVGNIYRAAPRPLAPRRSRSRV